MRHAKCTRPPHSAIAPSARPGTDGTLDDQTITGQGEAQLLACQFIDVVGVGRTLVQEGDFSLEARPHDLEGSNLPLQLCGAIDESGTRLETVPALDRVIAEVRRKT